MLQPEKPVTFRSTFNKVLCIVAWAALAVVLVVVLVTPGALERPFIPLGLVAVAAIVWALLWSPHLRVDDDAVTIANVLREIRVPWAALIEVDTKYSLTLRVPGKLYSATAAPAPGQVVGLRASRAHRGRAASRGDLVRPGDLASTDSGQAANLVRSRWDRLREAGAIETGVAATTPVGIRPRTAQIATVVAAVAVLIAGILLS